MEKLWAFVRTTIGSMLTAFPTLSVTYSERVITPVWQTCASESWADRWPRARRDLPLQVGSPTATVHCWGRLLLCAQDLWSAGSHDPFHEPAPKSSCVTASLQLASISWVLCERLLRSPPGWRLCPWPSFSHSLSSRRQRAFVPDTWTQDESHFTYKSTNIDGDGTHTFLVGFTASYMSVL